MITTEEILAELRKQREAISSTGCTIREIAEALGICPSQAMKRMNHWLAEGSWRKVKVMRPTKSGVRKPVDGYEPVKPLAKKSGR